MTRYLVLFARDPARQAQEKGFGRLPGAAVLFSKFADGWVEAAREAGASLVVSTPPEDLPGWRRTLDRGTCAPTWILQEGRTFGDRLRETASRVASLGGHAVVVGGDVAPCRDRLVLAFEALEGGADAVLAPAADGGVSIIAVRQADLDLLASIGRRRRDVFDRLRSALTIRGRRVAVLTTLPDVDGRRSLRGLLRGGGGFSTEIFRLGRGLLAVRPAVATRPIFPLFKPPVTPSRVLRGPPLAA